MKKILSVIGVSAALLAQSVAAPVTAFAGASEGIAVSAYPQLKYAITDYASCGLSVSNGFAVCSSKLTGSDKTTKITATQYLEKKSGSRYSIAKVWLKTVNGSVLTMANGTNGIKEGTYRLRTVFKVFAGKKSETITKYSAARKIKGGYIIGEEEAADQVYDDDYLYGNCCRRVSWDSDDVDSYEPCTENEGVCGEHLKWSVRDGVLTISGTGDMYDYKGCSKWLADFEAGSEVSPFCNRKDITSVIIEEGVTSIGAFAFNGTAFKELTLPGGIRSIGIYAFFNSDIEEIALPDSLVSVGRYAFYYTGLKSVELPDSVEQLGEGAFIECKSLERVRLSDNIRCLEGYIFHGCHRLTEITLPHGLERMGGASVFSGTRIKHISIPEGVKNINGLSNCVALESVDIPESAEEISKWAFDGCANLKNINIPERVETIEAYAFRDCAGLKSVSIPGNAAYIGECAFAGCSALESIRISNPECEIMGESAAISNVYIPNGTSEFNGTIYCDENSTAAVYAQMYDRKTAPAEEYAMTASVSVSSHEILSKETGMPCDINGDGIIDSGDITALQRALSGKKATADMDINGDGKVNVFDIVTLRRIIAESFE